MKSRLTKFATPKFRSIAMAGLLLSTVGLTSCLNDNDVAAVPDAGYISIYNGAPNSPGMMISTDVNTINQLPLNYSQTIGYKSFFPGKRPFYFSELYSASRLFEEEFTVKIDSVYSMFIINDDTSFDAILIDDDWEEPVADEAQMRFVHLSPNAGAVNVIMDKVEAPLYANTEFKGNSGFEKLTRDVHDFYVTSVATGDTLATAKDINLGGNRVYTLILKGYNETTDNTKKLDLQILTNYINY